MIKRLSVLSIAAVLAFSAAGAASAATPKPVAATKAKQAAVRVLLNGQPAAFATEPTIIGGRTYVDCESVFELFGYVVSVDSETGIIDAKSSLHEVQLSVGGDMAFVDGKAVAIDGQLLAVGKGTLIGLRFVAELSGVDVAWDDKTRTVALTLRTLTAEQEATVYAFIEKAVAAQTKEEALALLSPDSPIKPLLEGMPEQPDDAVTKTTLLDKRILSIDDNGVLVQTREDNAKIGGGFYADNVTEMQYLLRQDAAGKWGIYDLGQAGIEYRNVPRLFDQAVDAPADVKAAIDAVVDAQFKAAEKEDYDAYKATMDIGDAALETEIRQQVQQMWAAVDTTYAVQKRAIVGYSAEAGTAKVLLDIVAVSSAQGQKAEIHSVLTIDAVKKNGAWLLSPTPELYFQEQM